MVAQEYDQRALLIWKQLPRDVIVRGETPHAPQIK